MDAVVSYINEQLEHKPIDTASLEALLKSETEAYTLANKKHQAEARRIHQGLQHALQKALSDKSQLDSLYVELTSTKHELAEVRDTHREPLHDSVNDTSYARLFHSLKDLDHRLRLVDSAISYIKAVLVALHLWDKSMAAVKDHPLQAVQMFHQLGRFVDMVGAQDVVSTGPWRDLGAYLQKCHQQLWSNLDILLRKDFEAKLDELKWPVPLQPPYGPDVKSKIDRFEASFHTLLELGAGPNPDTNSCAPIHIMLAAIELRFRFHFEGKKPTNRLDKPEWYLKHIKTQIESHLPFLMTTVQPLMRRTDASASAKDAFIEGLLKNVKRKVLRTVPKLLPQPQWLSHTIHELLQFDHDLQQDYGFFLTLPDGSSNVADLIIEHDDWFGAWFSSERNFVQSRFDAMMAEPDAFDLCSHEDDHAMEDDTPVTTRSAVQLTQLLEGVLDTYRLVPHLRAQLHFFVRVQLGLLSLYHERIDAALNSFEARSLIRSVNVPGALPDAVTGVITANEHSGALGVLRKLYRWWASAKRIHDFIKSWQDEPFFLTMQAALAQSPESVASIGAKVPDTPLVSLSSMSQDLFGSMVGGYASLMERTQQLSIDLLVRDWAANTRHYTKSDQWWQVMDVSDKDVSSSLYPALQELWTGYKYLHRQYPTRTFILMYKHIAHGIEDHLWRSIITRNQFSQEGIMQLAIDLELGLWKVGKRVVNKPENYTRRLKEALLLFMLPLEDGLHVLEQLASTTRDQQADLGLGLDTLTAGEIRDVLRRRNDILSR
ncbi:TIP-1 family-domain-containing protein [Gongronella butleri]|nr:TIP-1 family-domain-containing protein [Gongronella butleri]